VRGKRVFSPIVFLCATLLWAVTAWGQASTALRGVVTDPSGAAVPGAKVTLVDPSTNLTRSVTTASDGAYTFPELLPGTYTLTVEATGFQKYVQTGLAVRVALPATQNVQLKVGAVTQVVSVSGQAPLLNTTNASIGETMGSTQILQLPLEARNVPSLLSIQPGVVYTSDRTDMPDWDTRGGAVNGERSDQNNITLDGVDVNDQFSGAPFSSVLPITVDSVQEFRVTTSNYGAQEGRSAGGQVELVTKGGTNNFHGSLYEYNRTSAGQANDYFIKTAEALNGQPNKPGKLIRNIFGGSIGGPFMKNRFFFFFNYEGRRDAEGLSALRTIPSLALRDGVIQYFCTADSSCSGGSVTGLSGKTYTYAPGTYAISPTQLTKMDPLGLGPNPAVVKYFNSYPAPNEIGSSDGLNFQGYRFAAPVSNHYNWLIGRLDYKITANGNHSLFLRGSGEDDTLQGQPFLPSGFLLGGIPETSEKDLNKGFVAGYTAIFGPHWVNNFRYGLSYQSIGISGNSNDPWNRIRSLDQGFIRGHRFTVPVHNFVDDVSWMHGSHNFQFGANFYFIRRNSQSQATSFSDGVTNGDWITSAGIAGSGDSLDPAANGLPAVDNTNGYDFPLVGLLGMVTEVDAAYNYHLNRDLTGTALPQGAPVPRHYSIDQYDLYWQDTWQMRPNLTFTYGLRWALMGPIGETAGQEVAPTFSLGEWFNQRGQRMRAGLPASLDPSISFAPAGPSYGKSGYYPWQTRNFAPRIGFAWTPRPSGGWLEKLIGNGDKTVVRAGFGMYYDHFGPGLALAFDNNGAFGLSTSLTNAAGFETITSSPRLTSMNVIPTTDNNGVQIFTPAPPAVFPQTFPATGPASFAIAWGLDSGLRTPYSYAIDFSIDRQLPGDMAISLSYVGHLAHRLLVQSDLAMPYDLVDKQTGISYFAAATRFSQLARQGVDPTTLTNAQVGQTAQYWIDMMAPLAAGDQYSVNDPVNGFGCGNGGPTSNPVVAAYQLFQCTVTNETTGLFFLDLYGIPGTQQDSNGDPNNWYYTKFGPYAYYNAQYSSLYAWRSIGYSNYNSFQLSLKKRMTHGFLFDFNYTLSKSLDISSDAESANFFSVGSIDTVINSWSPYQLYGPSSFDLRHQLNADWVWQLPFGRGQMLGRNVGRAIDAAIGGWQLSGVARWTTGFPGNANPGYTWPTNWELSGNAILTGTPQQGTTSLQPSTNSSPCTFSGGWNMFSNPCQAYNAFDFPYPGQSGVRDAVRGQGYAGWDMGLSKVWHMPYNDSHTVQFRWDVFNVPNLKRFDVQSVNNELDLGTTNWGKYTRLLTNPRIMQFALRYQF
jgi:hypothetical protein